MIKARASDDSETPLRQQGAEREGGERVAVAAEPTDAIVGFAEFDRLGRCVRANERLCAMLAYRVDELQALTLQEITDPEHWPADRRALELLEAGEISLCRGEKRLLCKDGTGLWVDAQIVGVLDRDGRLQSYAATVQDISDRKGLEAALQRRNDRLVQFASLLGHDLRSVLNVMALHAQLAKASLDDGLPQVQGSLDTIVATAHEAATFMTQLQEYAASLTHHADLDRVSLQRLVTQALAVLEPLIQAKHAQVEVGELPRVMSKEAILGRVLLNLIRRSLEQHSGAAPRVEIAAVSCAIRRGFMGLVLRDNGPGFPKEQQADMHMSLLRGEELPGGGMGLGLAFCREHIEDIGGSIWLESAPGQGTQVVVLLPGG
ncbi:MAG: ATP-binding protein [Pseudomonadales bacterium]